MSALLDVKDRKLLEIFTDNAGMPIRQLAKQVGISREVAAYRLKRFKKLGIVPRIVARVNMTKFYNTAYIMYLRFSKLDEQFLKQAAEFFRQDPFVMWAASLGGEYDIGTSFLARSPQDLAKFMQSMEQAFGKNLQQYDLFPYEREYKNTYRVFFTNKQAPLSEALLKNFEQPKARKLDEKDKLILYALSKDAELTNEQLAGLVGLSEEAVRLRKKNYEKTGIISGYRAIIDLQKMGLSAYYMFLKFDNMTPQLEKKIETYMHLNRHVNYCAKIIGKFNIQACVWATSQTHYQSILQDLRNTFSDSLAEFRSQIIFTEHKHTYFPPAAILDSDIKKVDDYFAYRHIL
jgi:Lrp/AsnC family leucine-responsive transcriptional regulator